MLCSKPAVVASISQRWMSVSRRGAGGCTSDENVEATMFSEVIGHHPDLGFAVWKVLSQKHSQIGKHRVTEQNQTNHRNPTAKL